MKVARSMRRNYKIILVVCPVIYILVTAYFAYRSFYGTETRPAFKQFSPDTFEKHYVDDVKIAKKLPAEKIQVEIWGKAAIAMYLWTHILKGELFQVDGFVKQGELSLRNISFTFRWGPGVIPTTVPSDVSCLVLVLNGHSQDKIATAKQWLEALPQFTKLKHTAVVLLGSEECENSWILPYMRSRGGLVDVGFVVYDSPLVDNKQFYQWPLGVATYRNFPDHSHPSNIDLTSPRSHLCNFLGTVYANSSRQALMRVLESPPLQDECIVRGRSVWVPLETQESLNNYINSLQKSDLTLNPVGKNTECYRIYEAFSLGSIPVVEDVVTPGVCDGHSKGAPLRLLKRYNAPIILIKNWLDLPALLKQQSQMTLAEKVNRRVAAVKWYADFKRKMKAEFIRILLKAFVQNS